jgi:hypothetical protein
MVVVPVARRVLETGRRISSLDWTIYGRMALAEILSHRNSRVNGSFSGCDGHVGSVGNKRGSLHDGLLAAIDLDGELGEILQYFSHLVTSLTTANVDNNVTVGELGHRLTNDSLSTTESTGDGDGTTLNTGKKGVEDSLADNEGLIGRLLVVGRTGHSNRPGLHHGVLGLLAIELDLEDVIDNGVLAL